MLWNPSLRELADVEEDEAGMLRRFRERFGGDFEVADVDTIDGEGKK